MAQPRVASEAEIIFLVSPQASLWSLSRLFVLCRVVNAFVSAVVAFHRALNLALAFAVLDGVAFVVFSLAFG